MNDKNIPLLHVRHLSVDFVSPDGAAAHALEDVSFDVYPGQTLGLVGESGCGKTTTLMAIMRLLPASGRITSGQVMFDAGAWSTGESAELVLGAPRPGSPRGAAVDLLSLSERQMRQYRWKEMAIVFQGAMNALNPVMKVGPQIGEAILQHNLMDRHQTERRVAELLELVGISASRGEQYPHQFSGGMRQRAMIAMALACSPRLLFADEPTTALDVMIQAQVLELLKNIQQELGLAIVLVTHDLGVVAEVCDSVAVMYGGKVAEYGSSDQVYNAPQHPYTQRLLEAFPDLNEASGSLASIPGTPPRLTELPPGCRFEPRCHVHTERCRLEGPRLVEVGPPGSAHLAACHLLQGREAKL